MKAFVVACALFAVATAAPNGGYGMSSGGYSGGSSYGGQTIPMQASGSPPVKTVPNNSYGSQPVTYTAPGATYTAAPITYAAPMLTFHPPSINYKGQSVTYATAAQEGYSSGGSSYGGNSGYSAPAPQIQSYQPSSSYSSGY